MQEVVDQFNIVYYESQVWAGGTHWMGYEILKTPTDMWTYQEIIFQTRPDVIIECGTYKGASALFFANLFDIMGNGQVITMDILEQKNLPKHPRIKYMVGDTLKLVAPARLMTSGKRVMVILDSDHSKNHVFNEMQTYGPLVTPGCYMIVEDTNIHGHPVRPNEPEGPYEAVEAYMQLRNDFAIDKSREKFLLTSNPNGYLLKK